MLAVEVFVSTYDATCFQCNGVTTAFATGGVPPYSYLWSPAPPVGQGTNTAQGLCPGSYSVEVTDGSGSTAVANFTINMLGGLNMFVPATELQYACDGGCTGWATASLATMGGTPPYAFDFPFAQVNGNSVSFGGLCPGTTTITVTDANGCAGTIQANISSSPMGFPGILSTSPACGTQPSGSITMPAEIGSDVAYWVQSATFDSLYNFGFAPGPYVLGGIPPGTHTVYFWWNQGGISGVPGVAYCTTGTDFTITSLPEPCGSVSGQVFHDADEDCLFNNFDLPLANRVLSIAPGGQFTITDGNGEFQRLLNYGTYTLDQGPLTDEDPLCPASGTAGFTLDAGSPSATINFANLSTVPHDLSVQLTSTAARPGFPTQVWITVTNNSAFPSGDVSLALTYDPLLLNPGTSTWDLGTLAPYGQQTRSFSALVPANVNLLGTVITYTASITNTASEVNVANNLGSIAVTITGSYDPNDKQGSTSSALSEVQFFLAQDEWIDYTVRFQNTGTDTAFTVVIRDELDADIDVLSLEITGASHPFTPLFGEGRELVLTFNDILLPDSTTDLLGSQGFVRYRIRPNSTVAVGTLLENTASIYFDLNPPIITNTVEHLVDVSTSVQATHAKPLLVMPNPVNDVLTVTFSDASSKDWQLYSIHGRSIDLPQSHSTGTMQLDVRCLDAGTYVLRTGQGSAVFIKQ
jgi:uncharacterized repeat protein (TIGR01451 family)